MAEQILKEVLYIFWQNSWLHLFASTTNANDGIATMTQMIAVVTKTQKIYLIAENDPEYHRIKLRASDTDIDLFTVIIKREKSDKKAKIQRETEYVVIHDIQLKKIITNTEVSEIFIINK